MIRFLEMQSYKDRMKELQMFSFGTRRLSVLGGNKIIFFKYLKKIPHRRQDLFSIIPEGRTLNNGFILQECKFQMNIRKDFLTIRTV